MLERKRMQSTIIIAKVCYTDIGKDLTKGVDTYCTYTYTYNVLLMYTAWGLTRVHWKELQTDISTETTIHKLYTNIQNSSVVFSTEVG